MIIPLRSDDIIEHSQDSLAFAVSCQVTVVATLWQRCSGKLDVLEAMSHSKMP